MSDHEKQFMTPVFDFVVGQDQHVVKVHTGVIEKLSPPLWALISNGVMKESVNKTVTLDDVELDVFLGFVQFAYSGQYTTPTLDSSDEASSTDDATPPTVQREWPIACEDLAFPMYGNMSSKAAAKAHRKAPKAVQWIYRYRQIWAEHFCGQWFGGTEAPESEDPDIMFHARLYVFATKYLIQPLQEQCLASLHRDLRGEIKTELTATRLFELLDYTYSHTHKDEPVQSSGLRGLVSGRAACEAGLLTRNRRFGELLRKYADLGADMVPPLANF